MEPIERELEIQKDRRKRLAIELQTLEGQPMPRKAVERAARQDKLQALQFTLEALAVSIEDLEEIIAEGPNPPRIPRPSNEGRRRLTAKERKTIEARTRADLRKRFGGSDAGVKIHVASVTGPDGLPEVHIEVGPPGEL
jgi:hypothetical protein